MISTGTTMKPVYKGQQSTSYFNTSLNIVNTFIRINKFGTIPSFVCFYQPPGLVTALSDPSPLIWNDPLHSGRLTADGVRPVTLKALLHMQPAPPHSVEEQLWFHLDFVFFTLAEELLEPFQLKGVWDIVSVISCVVLCVCVRVG